MKKVLFITDFFKPDPGGIEKLYAGIARNWERGRFRVCVTAKSSGSTLEERLLFDETAPYTVDRIPPDSDLFFWKSRHNFRYALSLVLDRFLPDHLVFGGMECLFHFPYRLIEERQIPFSICVTGADLKRAERLRLFRYRNRFKAARHFFVVSGSLAAPLLKYGVPPEKIELLPPGYELHRSRGDAAPFDPSVVRQLKKKSILLAVGPLVPWKGFESAIEAMGLIRERSDSVHLVIAGSGPEYQFLQELIRVRNLESCVTMTGFISEPEMEWLMKHATLLVQPYTSGRGTERGPGMALIEAAHFGLPVVAGRTPLSAERIIHGKNGLFVVPGDSVALANRLLELLTSPPLLRKMGLEAKQIARREYQIETTCRTIDRIVSNGAQSGPGGQKRR